MVIQEFRLVLRAYNFERTRRFYSETLALPERQRWENSLSRGALFQVGTGTIELLGPPPGGPAVERPQTPPGPQDKVTLTLRVPSAEEAYKALIFRDRNIPGGLLELPEGGKAFDTHDPDGVKIRFLEVS